MFMHVAHPESMFYHVYDLLSQAEIKRCVWADDKLGIYCRYKRNKRNPEYDFIVNEYDETVTEIRRGKIKLTYRGQEE